MTVVMKAEKKPTVVILSGVRWGFLWQRHQTLATLFARAGYPTIFVETTGISDPKPTPESLRPVVGRLIGKWSSGSAESRRQGSSEGVPSVYSPLVAPPTHGIFRSLNGRYFVPRIVRELRRLPGLSRGERPVIVAYPPTRTTLQLVGALSPRMLYYDCSDEYSAFPGAPHDIRQTEREIMLRAEVVSCTSGTLLRRVRGLRPDAALIGPGVEYDRFSKSSADDIISEGERKTVCYFGDVTEARLDVGVIAGLAGAGFRVRLVGEVRGRARWLLGLPNVEYRGVVGHHELPGEIRGAIILPYRENPLTSAISPAKLYECLATGLPIVSTPLPSMKAPIENGLVYPARNTGDYIETLLGLRETESGERVKKRRRLAEDNSWETVFARAEGMIWRELARNQKN